MTYVVYASVPPPPPALAPDFQGLTHTVTGWDGTRFDLSIPSAGVLLLADGVDGLGMPEFDQYVDEYASVDGGQYQGSRARTRSPEWLLGVWGDSSEQWRARDHALWRIIQPDRPAQWTVTDPEGRTRTLMVRFRSSSPHKYSRDPSKAGWAIYTVTLMAEQPFWSGPPINSPVWGVETPVNFTGPTDLAPDYYVSAAADITSAEIENPGDVGVHVVWTVKGLGAGLSSVSIGAAGGSLGFTSVAAGSTLRITTDPTSPVAYLNTVDVSGAVTPWDPRPLPPLGEVSPVTITLGGAGTVQGSFVPRYFRGIP
jgi:hypothetical protein